ncbi:MAG: diaminopimelate decarboxylase [Actinomycetota bacterium]
MAGPLPRHLLPDHAAVSADGRLSIAGCDVLDLAAEFGTPLFVYDEEHLRARCREAVEAFGDGAVYATKAFLCTAMARLVHEEGMRLDVATGGELFVALHAGVPADRLVMHGNNKSLTELAEALDAGVGRIVIDSFEEIDRLEALVAEGHPVPQVHVRITPGVEAHTHEFVRTGQDDSKFGFGVNSGDAERAVKRVASSTALDLVGLHCHIGSQVFRVESYTEAMEVISAFAAPFGLPELSVGGGLGVAYVEGEESATIPAWAGVIRRAAEQAGLEATLFAEPGRAIAAAAAVTLYRVGTMKHIPGVRTYVAVDGGMSDNPRPVLYGSGYEAFLPRNTDAVRSSSARIVGKHCESGDVLIDEAALPDDLVVGDVLATPVTGAYGLSMGSNYNKIRRPAAVFVKSGEARLVVRRETYEDLVACDVV